MQKPVSLVLGLGLVCLFSGLSLAVGQSSSTGSVSINVIDQAGAAVPGAQLTLRNPATNDIRKAETPETGSFTLVNLIFGTYELTVAKTGFATQVFSSVVVQTSRITTINASLQVATTKQTITVAESAVPLTDTESSVISDTIDTKQVTSLPMVSRNVMGLAFLVPGWAASGAPPVNGGPNTNGTWNNLPGGAVVSAEFDGAPGQSNRFRSGGFAYGTTVAQPRIEDVAEMTVSTAQIDLSGNGTAAMRISIVGRHGTNQFHGRLFEDFRNTSLNANSWINNARSLMTGRPKLRALLFQEFAFRLVLRKSSKSRP